MKEVVDLDVEVAVVVGGGNIWRGKIGSEMGMERASCGLYGDVSNCYELASTTRFFRKT